MKTIIVTGATSFIGVNLINILLKSYKVIAIVRLNSDKIDLLPENENLTIVEMNMSEYSRLPEVINKKEVHGFIHLAWNGTRGADRNNVQIQEDNYNSSLEVLHCAKILGSKFFMSAGSQAEYGSLKTVVSENIIPIPVTAYGKYKLKFYEYSMKYCDKAHVRFLEPRFFSIYGKGDWNGTLVMTLIKKMKANENIDLTDCEQYWNFLNIKDAINGMIHLIENDNIEAGAYNFASERTCKLKEYILEMQGIINSNSKLNFGAIPHNDSGMYGINPDISKLLSTGWKPNLKFCDGIREIID